MKKTLTVFLFAFVSWMFFPAICKAQYSTGVGIRVGKFASGIDVKKFFDANHTLGLEFYGGYTREAYGGYLAKLFLIKQVTISKSSIPFPFRYLFKQSQMHIPVKFIYGAGAHVSYFKERYYDIQDGEAIPYGDNITSMGVDATIGLEYNTRKIPFTIGIDATPFYSFMNPGPEWIDFGLNVRYIFR